MKLNLTEVIVRLRTELGNQQSRAQKIHDEAQLELIQDLSNKNLKKEVTRLRGVVTRIQAAQHALGALVLGDIKDTDI